MLLSNPPKCSICRQYGFAANNTYKCSDLPEYQPSLQSPSFINHSASLISSLDLDEHTEQAGLRSLAFRTDGIYAFQTVVSSVLLSPSYSPAERAATIESATISIFEQYRIYRDELYGVLSEPFHSLEGLTPLEHEIIRWDPMWEGEGGAGIVSSGMEMIQILIENWKPRHPQTALETNWGEDGVNGEENAEVVTDAHREDLLFIVRNACLRRLSTLPSEYHNSEEDITNALFQRIVRLVWFTGSMENDRLFSCAPPSNTCAGDFSVSLAYDPNPADIKGKLKACDLVKKFSESSDFTALISIPRFYETLRESHSESAPYPLPSRSSTISRSVVISSLERANRRPHPYTRPVSGNEVQMARPVPRPITPTSTSPSTQTRKSGVSSRLYLVDFIAAHRAWTLGVGHNVLQLAVHGQIRHIKGTSYHADKFSVEGESTPEVEKIVHAEVRVVTPARANDAQMNEISEHVFTFPTFDARHFSNAKAFQGETYRISPCFTSPISKKRNKPEVLLPITRFDDQRILHSGELMLELRVRMQQSLSLNSESTTVSIDSCPTRPWVQVSNDKSDDVGSAWSVLSPTSFGTSSFELPNSSDLRSGPPGSLTTKSQKSGSWVHM